MSASDRFDLAAWSALSRAIAGAVLLLWASATAVSAGTCREQVRALADQYSLAIEPPSATPGEPADRLTAEELARSGGVIEPPATSDPAVIEPPEDGRRYGMPTVPPVPDEPETPDAAALSAANRATVESLLIAARADAEAGEEADCLEKLQNARDVILR